MTIQIPDLQQDRTSQSERHPQQERLSTRNLTQSVYLDNNGDTVRVPINDIINSSESIEIHLKWNKLMTQEKSRSRTPVSDIDLDLGCFYCLKNGMQNVIDGLQFIDGAGGPRDVYTRQGCYTESPFIWHSGDDRSGTYGDGESILINPKGIREIKKILLYTFIYEGVSQWSLTDAVITIKFPGKRAIVMEMGEQQSHKTFAALLKIEVTDHEVVIKRDLTFHFNHMECDKHYDWGFTWNEAKK